MKYVGVGKLMMENLYTKLYVLFSTCMDCLELKRCSLMFMGQLYWDRLNGACVAPIYILACFGWKHMKPNRQLVDTNYIVLSEPLCLVELNSQSPRYRLH